MLKKFLTFVGCGLIAFNLSAQKLPDTQKEGFLVPSNVRIDGKNLEWDNFLAKNKRTDLYYSIANNGSNLFLAIKAENKDVISKIFMGGITFSVNTQVKKKEEGSFQITFPIIKRAANIGGGGQGRQRMAMGMSGANRQEMSQSQRDSLQLAQHKTQLSTVKEIGLRGFKTIQDSLISIYNIEGIKVVAKIQDDGSYFCEISIPLTLMNLVIDRNTEIAYQIKLNGRGNQAAGNFAAVRNNFGSGRGGFGGANIARQELMMATDFWSKYKFVNP